MLQFKRFGAHRRERAFMGQNVVREIDENEGARVML